MLRDSNHYTRPVWRGGAFADKLALYQMRVAPRSLAGTLMTDVGPTVACTVQLTHYRDKVLCTSSKIQKVVFSNNSQAFSVTVAHLRRHLQRPVNECVK